MTRRQETPPDRDHAESSKPRGFDDFEVRLGDIMRGERATMGKSLLDVQRELKIKATYIAAIENADPAAFETPGFVAGYVRSYARYLNLDPDWAFKTFCEEGDFTNPAGLGSGPKPARTSAPQARGASGPRDPFVQPSVSFIPKGEATFSGIEPGAIGSVAVLFALIAAIGYGGWSVLQEVQKVQFTPIEQAPGVLSELDPLTEIAPAPVDVPDDRGIAALAPATEAFDRLYRPQALDVPVLIPRDGPIATLDPSTVGVLVPEPGERVAGMEDATATAGPSDVSEMLPSVQVVENDVPEVVLFAVRPSWVRVRGADGTVIFEKILDAGERFVLPATEEPPTLRAGNSGSLYFAVNGETYGPAGPGASVVKDVALSVEALRDAYTVADIGRDADLARFVAVAEAQAQPAAE